MQLEKLYFPLHTIMRVPRWSFVNVKPQVLDYIRNWDVDILGVEYKVNFMLLALVLLNLIPHD